jgi:hypothetical protein
MKVHYCFHKNVQLAPILIQIYPVYTLHPVSLILFFILFFYLCLGRGRDFLAEEFLFLPHILTGDVCSDVETRQACCFLAAVTTAAVTAAPSRDGLLDVLCRVSSAPTLL